MYVKDEADWLHTWMAVSALDDKGNTIIERSGQISQFSKYT